MANAWLPTAHKMRLLGVMLVGVGIFFLHLFTSEPTGGIPGFPHAWRGAPLILGACFFGINGFYLLFQRKFSLAALLVAGIASSAVASAAQAYVRSIRDVVPMDSYVYLPEKERPDFIARAKELVTPDTLRRFADEQYEKGWSTGVDFESVYVTYGKAPQNKDQIAVTTNLEVCPFIYPLARDSRVSVQNYSNFLHLWIVAKLTNVKPDATHAVSTFDWGSSRNSAELELVELVDSLVNSSRVLIGSANYKISVRKARHNTLAWLRDREPNTEIKQFLSEALTEFDKLPDPP